MEKKSFMKKLTGSREALLAVILVLLFCSNHNHQPVIPYIQVSDGYAEKQCCNNGNVTWYAVCYAGRWN